MRPPETLSVLDGHGGFTAESSAPYFLKFARSDPLWKEAIPRFDFARRRDAMRRMDRAGGSGDEDSLKNLVENSLWRPGHLLKSGTTGTLLVYDEKSFYQRNDDVTLAVYRVKGYGYPVLVWFDNATGNRIA
jgi:hypothetical protein